MDNYDYGQDYEQDYGPGNSAPQKSIKGYQIIIIVLTVILAGLSFIYFNQMSSLKKEYAIERDTLSNRISLLMTQYDDLRTENDTIAHNLQIEREKADSLLESLTNERNLSRAKIRSYEKELGTLRAVMKNYVHQIDSLNTLNQQLIKENVDYRRQVTVQRMRAEEAEERADEYSTKIRKGAVIRVHDIAMVALNRSGNVVPRASRAEQFRVDFVLAGNDLAQPGARSIYVRIIHPDGYLLANSTGAMFDFEGEKISYSAMREVEYDGSDLNVSIFYKGAGITSGKYVAEIYMDGILSGKTEIILK